MNKNKKIYIPSIIIGLIFMIVIILLIFKEENIKPKLDLYGVSNNYTVEDSDGMMLYNRFQVEDGLLFNLVGSDSYGDYYGYFYKDNIKELPAFLKIMILANDADYRIWNYDEENRCYSISKDSYNVIYNKLFSDEKVDLTIDDKFMDKVLINDNSVCISGNIENDHNKVIDTYLVNIIRDNDKISIYERVAFIGIENDYLYFYRDYEMKDLVYKLKVKDNLAMGFINNSNVVSNVLLDFKNKFDIYEYTYVKGVDTYYLESIKK